MRHTFRWLMASVVALVIVLTLGLAWASASSGTAQAKGAMIAAQTQIKVHHIGPLAVSVECVDMSLTPRVNHNLADELGSRMVLTCTPSTDERPTDVAHQQRE